MADVSRSVYLSRKLSNVNDDSAKRIYDGIFSAPSATKFNGSNFSSPIDDYREIFPPSKASLGSSIPILDLPAVDLTVGPRQDLSSGFDYAGVFGGFGDNDGIGVLPEQLIRDSKKMAKRDANLPRSPVQTKRMPPGSKEFSCYDENDQTSSAVQTRRMPSKSQEFSRNYANDQTSSPVQTRRMPSKSQEFSSNYGNNQTSSPMQTRRVPSKSQEFSCNYGHDQTSSPVQTMRKPSKSQEFSFNYVNDQTSSPAETRRMPSKSQEFSRNYEHDQTSSTAQMGRMPAASLEFSCTYGNDQASSPAEMRRTPSKSQEFSVNHENDQTSRPGQTSRMPLKSQEISCNYRNDQTACPVQTRRIVSKSQEFSCNKANDQTSSPTQTRMPYSKSQEFPVNFSNSQMSTSPVPTSKPFSSVDELSGNSSNDQTSASPLPQQTADSVKHVSVSYHKTNQLSKDGLNGMTHIAHLHAVPGYTLLFDEAGPVKKTGFDKAKRMSMNDADFSDAVGTVSRKGKHTRAVSDLGTNKQASDYDPTFHENFGGGESNQFVQSHDNREVNGKPRSRSMSVSNSPQSIRGSDHFKRSASRRSNNSTNNQEINASGDPFPLLDEELDVNSAAAVSAAAMKSAIEEAEERIRWAKVFLKGLEANGFIKPTLKDSFKVKATSDTDHSYLTYRPKQNGSVKVKAARQKKCLNEEQVIKQNGYLNRKASADHNQANEAGGISLKIDPDITRQSQLENEAAVLKQRLHGTAAGLDATVRSPVLETFGERNAHDEFELAEKGCKHEGGGEWEAAKHLSQLFTGVKNRLVSFMSKQADSEKTVIQKEAPSKCESVKQSEERAYEVRNADIDLERGAVLKHSEEKVGMHYSTSSVAGESAKQSEDRAYEVRNADSDQERGAVLEQIEEKVGMHYSTSSVAGESAQDSTKISMNMEVCEAKENDVNRSGATSSPHIEMLTCKQGGESKPRGELEYIEAEQSENDKSDLNQDVSTEVKGELLEVVLEQIQEVLDGPVKIEHASQMGTIGLGECDEIPGKACQPQAYDDEGTVWEDEELVNQVQDLEPFDDRLVGSLDNEGVIRKSESCKLKDIEMPKDVQTKQEDVRTAEESCMVEECKERVLGAGEINCEVEDSEKIVGQNELSEATDGLPEVVEDDSEYRGNLAVVDDTSEQQDELFLSKNEEASVPDKTNQYAQGVKFSAEEMERMTKSASVSSAPTEGVEQPKSLQRAKEFIGEGICESTPCSSEVVDDGSEHDVFLPATDDILDHDELLSSSRNQEASLHNNVSQNAVDVDLPIQKERLTVETSTTYEPLQMADELNVKYMSEDSGSCSEVADESLELEDYLPAADDVCEKDEHSCLNRNAEVSIQLEHQYRSQDSGSHSEAADKSFKHDDYLSGADDLCEKDDHSCLNRNAGACNQDEDQYAQDGKVIVEEERLTTVGGEFEGTEQRSSRQMPYKLVREELTEISMSAGDRLDMDKAEKEIEESHEASSCTDVEMTECNTVFKFELNNSVEEMKSFVTDSPGNPDDDSEASRRESNEADEQNVSSHVGESSHKRRRWFVNPGILQVNERTLEMDQENAERFEVEDKVEICANETMNESGEGVCMGQTDAGSNQDQEGEGLHSTEGSHRRRRWFENSGGEFPPKPIPFTGVEVAAEMDHEIAQEFKHDVSSQSDIDNLANEKKNGADDQVECRASTEAGHRRRRWFENGEKLGAKQKQGPSILEEEMEVGANTANHEFSETSTSEDSANTRQSEGQNKEREKEKERQTVERVIREARQRAFAEARDRAATDARLKAAAAAQDRPGKSSSEAKPPSDKASMDAKLRVERAAVERATAEARERALQKAMSEKGAYKSKEKDPRNPISGPSSSGYATAVPFTSDRPNGATTESPQRRKAISERNKRTMERAAKALEEKNMRDILVQKEEAERSRFANSLDAEVKRWSSGKERNLRSLLSTLQYILGPDSGWQAIPLTELVTATAVRKAYKRAALCVHPDKLQQRRATIQQKYICEKVFDLLKDAWTKFNPDD